MADHRRSGALVEPKMVEECGLSWVATPKTRGGSPPFDTTAEAERPGSAACWKVLGRLREPMCLRWRARWPSVNR